jgi:hypothetical protein
VADNLIMTFRVEDHDARIVITPNGEKCYLTFSYDNTVLYLILSPDQADEVYKKLNRYYGSEE